ncbi:hypothetical protein OY671_009320, partial [Metschnikowia pulcherrima]
MTPATGTSNVSYDLGLEDAADSTAQAQLAIKINDSIDQRQLTQAQVAASTGMTQPKVSQIRRYQLRNISSERSMRALVASDQHVEIRRHRLARAGQGHCPDAPPHRCTGTAAPLFATIGLMKLALDHLVVAAADSDSGTRHVADSSGIAPMGGGAHPRMGTHNRVSGMAGGVYSEVIAIDPGAPAPQRPRWFGSDQPAMRAR